MTTTDRPATMCEAFGRTASIDADSIAPTMKLERKPIRAQYAAGIEDRYAADPHQTAHEPAETATAQPV